MMQINKKKLIMLLILIISTILLLIPIVKNKTGQVSSEKSPSVQDGVLNLTGWDFEKHNRINLNGKWEFYWNALLTKKDFENDIIKSDGLIDVPVVWNYFKIENKELPGFGYATYKLKVIIGDRDLNSEELLSLRINPMSTSYKLFVDGKLLESNGQVGTSRESAKPEYQPKIVVFKPPAQEFNIIIQVSNFVYSRGGIWYDISIGNSKQINELNSMIVYKDAFLIGSGTIMMLFYLSVYLMHKDDKSSLYFSLLCLLHIVRVSLYGDYFIMKVFPSINFESIVSITYLTIYWMPAGMYLLVRRIFPRQSSRKVSMMLICYATILSLITCIMPISIYTKFTYFIEGIMMISILNAVLVVFKAYLNKEKGSSILFIGGLGILVMGMHDILYQNNIINNPFGEMSSVGMFIFMFLLSFLLASRFASAFKEKEELSIMLTESLEKEKELTDKLYKLDKLKDEFLINTSHELKTPLHGIINITEAILQDNSKEITPQKEESLNFVISVGKKLSNLINDIIDFQSLKNNSLKIDIRNFDISAPVQVAVEVLRYMCKGKELILINNIPTGRFYVKANENRVRQIIFNLLGNALRFTEKGQVEIIAELQDEFIKISVRDTGLGIDKVNRSLIFESYEHFAENIITTNTSSGLGLTISKNLTEYMGGELWLEWTKPLEGSCFSFTLPIGIDVDLKTQNLTDNITNLNNKEEYISPIHSIVNKSQQNLPQEKNINLTFKKHQNHSILVVDDEVSNIKVLTDIFNNDYEIITAFSGKQAFIKLKEVRGINLVLLDVMMPGMSGFEVCKKIRERYSLFEIPILMLTVRNSTEDIAMGLEAGANDFLSKPFDAKELKARVATLLELSLAVKKAKDSEIAFLQAQVKPHFLFNALNSIAALCRKNPKEAEELTVDFASYLRSSFDFKNLETFTTINKELDHVKHYLNIEKVRFGKRLNVEYDIEEGYNILILPLILQPLVENAVKHGISSIPRGGKVIISIKKIDDGTLFSISDNGKGMSDTKIKEILSEKAMGSGIGLMNINKRLKNIYDISLKIKSNENQGTTVSFVLPDNNEEIFM